MNYEKCFCAHCGQSIEYPSEGTGQTVPCPTCEKPVTLMPANPPTRSAPTDISLAPVRDNPKEHKSPRTKLSNLTEETIRARTQNGDTPLHRAAKTGRISEIPRHLLSTELFMARNNSFARETPLHVAARYGQLDKVPKEFLTKETLTASTEYERKESKTGPTPPRTETPLHYAARYGHADQIPKEFLTPEYLSIEASGYRLTVLHQLAYANKLDLVPDIYANSKMWNLRNSSGQTPREVVETSIKQAAYVAGVRAEPMTEKQKEKLRFFGYAFDENTTKGQASDALDKCARDFPEVDRAYYGRPATEEQLAQIREINEHPVCGPDEPFYDFENGGPLTYGKAKDLIQEWGWLERQREREKDQEYLESEDFRIEQRWARIDGFRECTREQVTKAWAIVKSRMTDKSQEPDPIEVEDTMEELFPDFRKTAQDRVTYQCKDCGANFKARLPSVSARNRSSPIYSIEADEIQITIPCPSCGRDKSVLSLNVCKYICPNCSKECLVLKSQTGQSVTHFSDGCKKDFFAAPTEPSIIKPRIRVMQYVEQPLEQTNDNAPTEEQLQKIKEMELKLDRKAGITASQLDELLKLGDQSPRDEDLELFAQHGITYYEGDAFAIYAAADLVRCFENMFAESGDYTNISMASAAASEDPAVKKATITLGQSGQVEFTWPKRKLEQWYRKGAEY